MKRERECVYILSSSSISNRWRVFLLMDFPSIYLLTHTFILSSVLEKVKVEESEEEGRRKAATGRSVSRYQIQRKWFICKNRDDSPSLSISFTISLFSSS